VEFVINRGQEPTKYYNVRLSDAGRETAATAKTTKEVQA